MPRARQALLADSVATGVGAMFGTSPTTAYIESTSGVAAGGRTGLTTLTVAVLFILAASLDRLLAQFLDCPPLQRRPLIIVGSLMMGSIAKIKWDEIDEAFPAFLNYFEHAAHFKHRNRNRPWLYFLSNFKNGNRKMARRTSDCVCVCGVIFISISICASLK